MSAPVGSIPSLTRKGRFVVSKRYSRFSDGLLESCRSGKISLTPRRNSFKLGLFVAVPETKFCFKEVKLVTLTESTQLFNYQTTIVTKLSANFCDRNQINALSYK